MYYKLGKISAHKGFKADAKQNFLEYADRMQKAGQMDALRNQIVESRVIEAIIAELRKQGADDIIVFVGGVVPQQDYAFLYDAGVKGIYGPGTPIPASAKDVLEQIRQAVSRS